MNAAAFGASTQVPLDASPFKRSALTAADAQREVERMAAEPRVEISTEVIPEIVLPRGDEELLRERLPEADLQSVVLEYEAFPDGLSRPFRFQHSYEVEDAILVG